MKTFTLALFTILFSTSFSQDTIPLIKIGNPFPEPIVVTVDYRLSQEVLFQRALSWMKINSPYDIISVAVEGERIIAASYMPNAFLFKGRGIRTMVGMSYKLDIILKDGKYKLAIEPENFYSEDYFSSGLGYEALFFNRGKKIPKQNEAEQKRNIIGIERAMNILSTKLYFYLSGKRIASDDEW